jgi:hypothetical protein
MVLKLWERLVSGRQRKMSIQHWWNDTDKGKDKHSEIKISQYQFFHKKSQKNRPGFERWPPQEKLAT